MRMRRTLFAGLALAAAVPAAPAGPASAAPRQDAVERAVVDRLNAIRARHDLRRLDASGGLAAAAEAKTREILASGQLSHTSPDGTPMTRRVRRYVRARRVGETIAWVSPGTRRQAAVVVRSWMRSPVHRAAVLDRRFGRIGVARRRGRLGGGRVVVVTANLASAR